MPGQSNRRQTIEDILGGSAGCINGIWDEVAAAGDDFEPIPPGTYRCLVTDGKVAESPNRKPSYKLEFTILAGPHVNRKLWHDCWLTREALALAKRDLAKLGISRPEQLREAPPTFTVDVKVALRARDDGTSFNRVSGFRVIEDVQPPANLAPDEDEGEDGDDVEQIPF